MHGILEGYRNIIPPTVYPVVLLFLEMPCTEVDVNVHPSKTEVRFRQQSFVHDFVRDAVRSATDGSAARTSLRQRDPHGPSARIALTPPLPGSTPEASRQLRGGRRKLPPKCGKRVFRVFADSAGDRAAQ